MILDHISQFGSEHGTFVHLEGASRPIFVSCRPQSLFQPESRVAIARDSPIHGQGLFALCDLPSGAVVLRMDPELFNEQSRHPWNQSNRDVLPYYVNHSCEANAFVTFSLAERAMVVLSTKLIRKDQEITLDYHLLELGGTSLPCLCGTATCRGTFPINRKRR